MEYLTQAQKCLEKEDYEGYLKYTEKQCDIEPTEENKELVKKARKKYNTYQEIKEFLKRNKSDYYAVLGIPKTASQKEIKTAFNKLVMKFHPDITKIPESNAVARIIQKAYLVLSNPDEKKKYDTKDDDIYNYNIQNNFGNVRFRFVSSNDFSPETLYDLFSAQMNNEVLNSNLHFYENLYRNTGFRRRRRYVHTREERPYMALIMCILFIMFFLFL